MASPEVLPLLRNSVPSAIIAGGWCRDGFNGDHAKDIDVFIASAEYDAALNLLLQAEGVPWAISEHTPGEGASVSAGEDVMRVHSVEQPDTPWPVQLIEVPDPIAWVHSFDAHCNMIYLPLAGPAEYVACSPLAVEHATHRIFELNPLARESFETLKQRAEKFRARGYTVRMPEQSPGLDALDLLDALGRIDP